MTTSRSFGSTSGQFGDQRKRVVFEATANARWLDRLLRQDPTIEPVAVTPHKVRIIAETVAKTDKIDAGVLALLSKLGTVAGKKKEDEEVVNGAALEQMVADALRDEEEGQI